MSPIGKPFDFELVEPALSRLHRVTIPCLILVHALRVDEIQQKHTIKTRTLGSIKQVEI